MKRKFQVFVSSTYLDLQQERQAVIRALLELDCIPVGMEMFPAANDTQWDFIKRVIGECDYYLVVVAGRYGTERSDGMSYTEAEYRYARDIGKPVIAMLHSDPSRVSPDHRESGARKKKLNEFRKLCEGRLCQFWSSADGLAAKVATSIPQLITSNPSFGWADGREVTRMTECYNGAINVLRKLTSSSGSRYIFGARRLTHRVDANGKGLLVDEYELVIPDLNFPPQFFELRYGYHRERRYRCEPIVYAWDSIDGVQLEAVELKRSEYAVNYAVLLQPMAKMQKTIQLKAECHRENLWEELLRTGQTDSEIILSKKSSSLEIVFEAPKGRRWKSFRTEHPGELLLSEDRALMTWKALDLSPHTIAYRIALEPA